jgi:hypothetical protein
VQTWLESGANVGPINQAKSGAATVSWIEMPNMDTLWAQWANIPGLKGTLVTIYVGVWSSASIYDGAYVVAIMEIDEHLVSNWAQLTLVPPRCDQLGEDVARISHRSLVPVRLYRPEYLSVRWRTRELHED